MAEIVSPSERILDAAEGVLRRHGAEKANVVDIARALGMSHANIYRHFLSKKALLDAVAVRWLDKIDAPLEAITCDAARPAGERLLAWFDSLRGAKRRTASEDPELFQVYYVITQNAHNVVGAHIAALLGQLERIVADGVASGEFAARLDARQAARSVLRATVQFHHPAMVLQEPEPSEEDAHALMALLLAGLRATGASSPG